MPAEVTPRAKSKLQKWGRPLLALVLLICLYCVGRRSGWFDNVDVDAIKARVNAAGAWGYLVYIGLYIVGGLIQLPGILFITAAVAIYGKLVGFFVAHIGSFLSVCVTFIMIRTVGGKALASIEHPLMKALLAKVGRRPVLAVIVIRMIFGISPPLNSALAMSDLRFRDYALGSFIGLVAPVAFMTLMFEVISDVAAFLKAWLFG